MEGQGIVMNTMWEVGRTVDHGKVHWWAVLGPINR